MESHCDFQEVFLPAGGIAELRIPNAQFLRCVCATGRRFMLSIDGDPSVPCWAGWHWKAKGDTIQRLILRSLPGETHGLDVGFFFGEGEQELAALSITQNFIATDALEEKIPNNIFPIRYLSHHKDDTVIRFRGTEIKDAQHWGAESFKDAFPAGNFDRFGITMVENEASRFLQVFYRPHPGLNGLPLSRDGLMLTETNYGALEFYYEYEALSDRDPWSDGFYPQFSFTLWRSNPDYVNFEILNDSVLFRIEQTPHNTDTIASPALEWRLNGQVINIIRHLGLGDKGLRVSPFEQAYLGSSEGMIREALFRVNEYYEWTGGSEPVKLELFASRSIWRPEEAVSISVNAKISGANSSWRFIDGSADHLGFFEHTGFVSDEKTSAMIPILKTPKKILEFNFDPATGTGAVTFND